MEKCINKGKNQEVPRNLVSDGFKSEKIDKENMNKNE